WRARGGRVADRGTAQKDPRQPEAGYRQGAGVCDRRRACPGGGVGSYDPPGGRGVLAGGGPRRGRGAPGGGPPSWAGLVGERRAREIWFLCRRYSAAEAFQMGLVNKVVPAEELDAEVEAWCQEILALSPTAIAIAKRSFNADSENIKGIGALGLEALAL